MKAPGCLARRSGNQWICTPCGLTWDTDDNEPPECRPRGLPTPPVYDVQAALAESHEAIRGLLEFYGDMETVNRKKMAAYVYAKGVQTRAKEFLK